MIKTDNKSLKNKSNQLRTDVLNVIKRTGSGHISSSFSCVEILTALYYGGIMKFDAKNPKWNMRDRFLLSKGHACSVFYCILSDLGYFTKNELYTLGQKGSNFGCHLQYSVPGAEISSGSLGAGLGIGSGMALAAKMNRETYLTFVLMGDGECYEGSVWESVMFAAHHNLNNLIAIVDRNHMCCTDFTENALRLEPLDEKFKSFGFDVKTVNGHDPEQIIYALDGIRCRKGSRPLVIIADTVKSKGLKNVENTLLCHSYMPKGEKLDCDIKELEALTGGDG